MSRGQSIILQFFHHILTMSNLCMCFLHIILSWFKKKNEFSDFSCTKHILYLHLRHCASFMKLEEIQLLMNSSVSLNCSIVDFPLLSFQKAFLICMLRFIFSVTTTSLYLFLYCALYNCYHSFKGPLTA